MRIYLDNCVFQDLKNPNQKEMLDAIMDDKEHNIYCYSEAHLQDLIRDKSNEKFSDLEFMGTIVDGNCWYYENQILFDHTKPIDYYKPFPKYSDKLIDFDELMNDDLLSLIKPLFKTVPINLKGLIKKEDYPKEVFEQFSSLIENPTNLYEFISVFGDYTNDLSSSKKKDFKALISYLHQNIDSTLLFTHVGIEGFDGEKITDKEKFRESYTKHFLKGTKGKLRYDLFLDQYNGLEFFSFVKGKPRKQKMMSLINDGRHAFFGGFNDFVVSKDTDFINKTKFIYEMHGIQTSVLNIQEFNELLETFKYERTLKLQDMINESSEVEKERIIIDKEGCLFFELKNTYFSYFNAINYITNDIGSYYFFTKYLENMSAGSLKNEFEYLVNQFLNMLGPSLDNISGFSMEEIKDEKWKGRSWKIDKTIIELNFKGKLYLAFYQIDYIEKSQKHNIV